jgi:hypothetical protein
VAGVGSLKHTPGTVPNLLVNTWQSATLQRIGVHDTVRHYVRHAACCQLLGADMLQAEHRLDLCYTWCLFVYNIDDRVGNGKLACWL